MIKPLSIDDFEVGDKFVSTENSIFFWEVLEKLPGELLLRPIRKSDGEPFPKIQWVPHDLDAITINTREDGNPIVRKIKQMEKRRAELGYRW